MNEQPITTGMAEWLCLDIETQAGRPEAVDDYIRRNWWPSEKWLPATMGNRFLEAIEKKRSMGALLDAASIAVVALRAPVVGAGIDQGSEGASPYQGRTTVLHSLGEMALEKHEFGWVAGYANEREMLLGLRDYAAVTCGDATTLYGWNIRNFDLPRLRLACLRARVPLPPMLLAGQPCVDLMIEFCKRVSIERSEMLKLDTALKLVGMESHKGEVDGSMVGQMIEDGEIVKLLRYAAADVEKETEFMMGLTGRAALPPEMAR